MILNPGHSVGLQTAQGHSAGAWWPAHFPSQGRSGLAFSVWPEADAVGLARALAGTARTHLCHRGQPALVSPFPVPHPNQFSLGPDVVPEPFPGRMGKGSPIFLCAWAERPWSLGLKSGRSRLCLWNEPTPIVAFHNFPFGLFNSNSKSSLNF
jgi:hypothetical protein